jgi:hypothetical protein
MSTRDDHALTYFKMNLLQAEIMMNAMIAENKQREIQGDSIAYTEQSFIDLIEKYGIYHNAYPFYTGE